MSFTILDWQIIERINDKKANFNMKQIDQKRLLQLCFNIFPGIKTALHFFTYNRVHIDVLTKLFATVNDERFGKIECTVPILEDIDSNTALDVALEVGDLNLANAIL